MFLYNVCRLLHASTILVILATAKIFNLILQLGGIVASCNLLVNTCMF